MEQQLAILLADLSGYTALTEAHGAVSAADLVDKFVRIAGSCLQGNSRLQERNGDEIMIVADSPDHLLETAIQIMQRAAAEEHFLQVHGGLHIGNVLQRHSSYFGAAINLTARIASKAAPGTFWCSGDFMKQLSGNAACSFLPMGEHHFKNVQQATTVAAVQLNGPARVLVDPVCRMRILDISRALAHATDPDLYFCSEGCRHIYNNNYFGNN